ncbi:MAG: hypothetical protein IPK16_16505 [Anaerolineales bacterium]|nr:hypothetical protein [Anaerolineales bacterium]
MRVHDGDPNAEFSYRIVARRLGYEDDRLERAPQSDNDPNLFQAAAASKPSAWLQRPEGVRSDSAAVMGKTVTEKPVQELPPEPAPVFEDLSMEAPPASAPRTDVVAPVAPAPLPAGAHQLFAPVLGK